MRKSRVPFSLVFATIVLVGMGSGVVPAHQGHDADSKHVGELTVQGEILDLACYVAHQAKGPDHADCAKRCVKGGQPMGLLADDGTVYLLYANHEDGTAFEQAKEHAGQTVEITGVVASEAGIKGLEVRSVKPI